jgi:hypothetical protein
MFGLISKALGDRRHEAQAMALREIGRCPEQIPVRFMTSAQVKIFWLALTAIMYLCARRLGVIYIFKNSDAGRGRLMNRSQKSPPRLIQERSPCAKEPRLECAS